MRRRCRKRSTVRQMGHEKAGAPEALFDASRRRPGGARPSGAVDVDAGGLQNSWCRLEGWRTSYRGRGRGADRRARGPARRRRECTRCRRCGRALADLPAAAAAWRRRPGRFPTPARARTGSDGLDDGCAAKKRAGPCPGVGPARSERRRATRAGSEARSETPRGTVGGDPKNASSGQTLAVD